MLYEKAEARIKQYLTFLDKEKYRALPLRGEWEYGVTETIFRKPPQEGEMAWHALEEFPFSWGESGKTWWFRGRWERPALPPEQELFLEARPQTDAMVFLEGVPIGAVNPFHEKLRLPPGQPGEALNLALEAWAGHVFPGYHPDDGPRVLTTVAVRQEAYPLRLPEPRLLLKREAAYGLYYDALVLFEAARLQEKGSLLRSRVIRELHRALLQLNFTASPEEREEQCRRIREEIAPLLTLRNGSLAPRIYSVGNAHLDHAWLWPMAETSRKGARTCANMVSYLEEYPEFRYLFSQPVQMLDLKARYPDIFRRVKEAYRRGQWEPNGGMWVEADCNLAGGESLIRQFLQGRRATRELFGYSGDVLWLPDVFGYTAGMPQILKGCGMRWFVTSKISWNDTTRFPYDLFRWEGIDGTVIPTHFIPTAYEGRNSPAEAAAAWEKIQHKDVQSALLRSIGEGDGGGGTMRADLECMRRMEDLQGVPRNGWESLSRSLDAVAPRPEELPLYKGELYLELHRGTYTTQARIKRYNRKLEYRLREAEMAEARLFLEGGKGRAGALERRERLWEIWRSLLTLQFHDILPGTSVEQVNREAEEEYRKLERQIEALTAEAASSRGAADQTILVNSLPWERRAPALCPKDLPLPPELPCQILLSLGGEEERLLPAAVPALALASPAEAVPAEGLGDVPFALEGDRLETPWYEVVLDDRGGFSRLLLKETERELIPPGEGMNRFLLCEDLPVNWDAWDIEEDYRQKEDPAGPLLSREVLSCGPLCLQIRQKLAIGKRSELVQDILFYRHSPRIDFRSEVEWREEHSLLRVNFPTTLEREDAFFDIPFGFLRRDTHRNTPRDRARFEVCAHKWAALKEPETLAALLSDCKYGYRVEGGLLSLTLLRSPTAPDPHADQGRHSFTYAFFASPGKDLAPVIREGWELNIPLGAERNTRKAGDGTPLFSFDSEHVMVESLKIAEEGEGVILRIGETSGAPRRVTLTLREDLPLDSYIPTNLLEDPEGEPLPLPPGRRISLELGKFAIRTLRFS